jgi:hypothetical protein
MCSKKNSPKPISQAGNRMPAVTQPNFESLATALMEAEKDLRPTETAKLHTFREIPLPMLMDIFADQKVPVEADTLEKMKAIVEWAKQHQVHGGEKRPEKLQSFLNAGMENFFAEEAHSKAAKAFESHIKEGFPGEVIVIQTKMKGDDPVIKITRNNKEVVLTEEHLVKEIKTLDALKATTLWEKAGTSDLSKTMKSEAKTAEGLLAKFKGLHWGAKTAIIGGTVAVGAFIAYALFKDKNKDNPQTAASPQL